MINQAAKENALKNRAYRVPNKNSQNRSRIEIEKKVDRKIDQTSTRREEK